MNDDITNYYLKRKIKALGSSLTTIEQQIAEYLINSDDSIGKMTLDELATYINVSKSSIFQFIKKLGFEGYQDFKMSVVKNISEIRNDNFLSNYHDIDQKDTTYDIAMKVLNSNVQALLDLRYSISQEQLDHILEIINKSTTLHFFGLGGSSVVAYDSYHKFMRSKHHVNYIQDYHMQLSYTTKMGKNDCVFIFSHSGMTRESNILAEEVKRNKAKLIVLSGISQSNLAQLADETVIITTEESAFRTEALMARLAYISIMDFIYINVMLTDQKKNTESIEKIRKSLQSSRIQP
ncbi:MurR/RpiR family transcriptional regulator [Globicatella sp. PHS-GS-PNBC-21-1553]|uniref:MurR/RpiR family transcriptional regulator n=1 Tax=Globicatella sp. PHS-GS-PNBC-21-1553 TaxID=2885764 RepID=UPI00298EE991|nr:MurR/RpiR family transcriptional regulator [Globicatella sp. PHS-GS-PNBC-21-1553]WPC08152.1 MurR/RpiR family transcriptional regulator [Globicatella sp. PHS-GS-PNBC-21-1553]